MMRLAGKRIAVIGAGSVGPGWGNGKAAAMAFAREGARVLCVDRHAEAAEATRAIIADEGGVAAALAADVRDPASGLSVTEAMAGHFGGLDVLHYNVGISAPGGVTETTEESWAQVMEINLSGAMRMAQAAVPGMRAQGDGALIFVSSLAAVMSGPYSYVSYEASKAALCRMSRSIARENASRQVRSNCILPGMIDTPHVSAFIAPEEDAEALRKARARSVPMGRQGTAWDVAAAAVFLASDESTFITGIDLRIDGGLGA